MSIKTVVKHLHKIHRYIMTKEYWGRVGMMCKRYGEETVTKALEDIPEQSIPLDDLLNMVEKRCQYIIENGELDDLAKELLS